MLVNPIEMNSPKEHVAQQLQSIPGYAKAFADAFPGQAAPITLENVQKAIAAFETTLITPNAPFDQFLGSLQGDQPKVTIPILPASGPDTTRPVRN